MADREVLDSSEVPEIDEVLEQVLVYALDYGRKKLEEEGELVPFTVLAVGESLFIESHPSDSAEECYALARHTVQGARGASCYVLCYDGYVETDDGEIDALIAEGGLPGVAGGHAVGVFYKPVEGEAPQFQDDVVYVGEAPNFMEFLVPLEEELLVNQAGDADEAEAGESAGSDADEAQEEPAGADAADDDAAAPEDGAEPADEADAAPADEAQN